MAVEHMPAGRRALDVALPVAAAGALVGLVAATWSGLWQEPPTGKLALVAAVGVVPALVRVSGVRRAVVWASLCAGAAAIIALAAAVDSNPARLVRGDGPTWTALGEIIPNGLGNAAATPLPLSPERASALGALLVLVLAGAASLIAWQIVVARRPLAGVIATATGLAYRWTLVPPLRPVLNGVLTLLIALAAFRLAGPKRATRANSGRTAIVGGLVVVLALAGSVGSDRAPASWWDWREWNFGSGRGPTSLSLKQNYGPLAYPDDPVLVARVEADEAVPLRMVALDTFDGNSFVLGSPQATQIATRGRLQLVAETQGASRDVTQKITIGNARSPFLLAGGRPSEVTGLGRREVTVFDDGSVRLKPSLTSGITYSVDALVPDPGPSALLAAAADQAADPALLSVLPGSGLGKVQVPLWGESGAVPLDPEVFGQYQQVYQLSRRIIGNAKRPYVAVNRIEEFLRTLEYDENAPRSIGTPDLVDFLITSKRGYCQHFAGSMALMLRMNGIPARVVVGFTSDAGRFDPDKSSYEIIDRDAHSWVEVQFAGFGWMPFDPTPGRSVPNSASVSSPDYSREGIDIDDPESSIAATAIRPAPSPDRSLREPEGAANETPSQGSGARRLLWAIPAGVLAALLAPLGLKAARRARRRRGDERARVLGAAREFESFLLDLGYPPDPATTTAERIRASWRELGIDAAAIYGLASAARFDPSVPRVGSGDAAWRAFAAARRGIGWRRRARAGLRFRSLRD